MDPPVERVEPRTRVLVVDDEPFVLRMVARILEPTGQDLVLVSTAAEALTALASRDHPPFDLVLTDLHLPDTSGIEVIRTARAECPTAILIMMTGRATIATAVEAMRHGAYDYILKPFEEPQILLAAVERAVGHKRLADRNRYLEQRLLESEGFEDLVGASAGMRQVASLAATVGPTDATVLVLGESGTGKELVVRAIHKQSPRRAGPFVAINCGALSESVLESELFGHAKGAFTGALSSRRGLFEAAAGGTLFLDEIGDLPPSVQVRLLRVLQEREVRPVGSNDVRPVDVRVVAATHRDLEAEVVAGRFRRDLFYRIHIVTLEIPPLRARMEDVPLLALHFLRKHARRHRLPVAHVEPRALAVLQEHAWPGNVRELENAMERAAVLCRGDTVTEAELRAVVKVTRPSGTAAAPPPIDLPLAAAKLEFERNYLQRLVLRADGNLADAARLSGLDRSNLRRLLRRHDCSASDAKKGRAEGG